jgi:hypothetical protein
VNWNAGRQKWVVKWRNPATGKMEHIGYFAVGQEEAAARCYDAVARKHGGTVVNFPDERAGETQAHAGVVLQQRLLAASGFRGVTANRGDHFQAFINVAGSHVYLGIFTTAEEAAQAGLPCARAGPTGCTAQLSR